MNSRCQQFSESCPPCPGHSRPFHRHPTTLLINSLVAAVMVGRGQFCSSSRKLSRDNVLIGCKRSADQWPKFPINVDYPHRCHALFFFFPPILFFNTFVFCLSYVSLSLPMLWIMLLELELYLPEIQEFNIHAISNFGKYT